MVVGTPQQNGMTERMIRTILERVRYMLLGARLLKSFEGEIASTTCSKLQDLMEVWNGRPTNFDNLKLFGTLVFAQVKKDKLESIG